MTLADVLRSSLFALALVLVTPPYALLALATFPLPRMTRYRIISGWSRLVIVLAQRDPAASTGASKAASTCPRVPR